MLDDGFQHLDNRTGREASRDRCLGDLRTHPSPTRSIGKGASHNMGDEAMFSYTVTASHAQQQLQTRSRQMVASAGPSRRPSARAAYQKGRLECTHARSNPKAQVPRPQRSARAGLPACPDVPCPDVIERADREAQKHPGQVKSGDSEFVSSGELQAYRSRQPGREPTPSKLPTQWPAWKQDSGPSPQIVSSVFGGERVAVSDQGGSLENCSA